MKLASSTIRAIEIGVASATLETVRAALRTDRQIERARIEAELAAKQAELDAFGTD